MSYFVLLTSVIGSTLRSIRKQRGMSGQEVAGLVGIGLAQYLKYERGEVSLINPEVLTLTLQEMDVSVASWLRILSNIATSLGESHDCIICTIGEEGDRYEMDTVLLDSISNLNVFQVIGA